MGLNKITFIPYGYLLDLWRWDIFSGKTSPANYNSAYWKLRRDLQGLKPPVPRDESNFDPPAKYHVVSDTPYIRYFIAFILQFQFHQTLCTIAKEYEPGNPQKALHNCDIYQNKDAGKKLSEVLTLGQSVSWEDALAVVTGQKKMDASALLNYFRPLQEWLEAENKKNKVTIGWD